MEKRKRILSDIYGEGDVDCDEDVYLIQYENYMRSKETSRIEFTHICMENNICYLIEDEEYEFFSRLYSSVIVKGTNKLIELPKKVFPATFQFVFDCDGGNGEKSIHFLRRLIEKMFYILKSLFKTDLVTNIEECMVAKSIGRDKNQSLFIVQFKNIVIFNLVSEFVRNQLLEDGELKEMFDDFQFENSFSDAFKSDTKLLMVGSTFDGELLEYSKYKMDKELEENFDENLLETWEINVLLKYTSIRRANYSEVMPLSVFGEFNISISSEILFQNEYFISEMVEMINPELAREEDIMWALINISSENELFPIMENFSVNINRVYWNQMLKTPNPEKSHLGISTLVYFGSIHSGKEFKMWMFENIWLFIRNACDKYISFELDKKNGRIRRRTRTRD